MQGISSGKVLILGGYLVLFPQYFGIVLGCSSKITCTLRTLPGFLNNIWVKSRQFNLETCFKSVPFVDPGDSNVFISETLKTVLYFVSLYREVRSDDIEIEIQGDEAFYTCGKTGLGSSAALTTALVKVILQYYELNDLRLVHYVAQVSHFRAQEKIGSGFDVSAAVYGSILFRRHLSEVVKGLLDELSIGKSVLERELEEWKVPEKFGLGSNLQVILCCNQKSGANTRLLVRELLKWVEEKSNFKYFDEMQSFILEFLESLKAQDWESIKMVSKKVKTLLRFISIESGVEILPEDIKTQMELVESTLNDVVFSSVPGAGGYDAYYILIKKETWNEARDYLSETFPDLQILDVQCGD